MLARKEAELRADNHPPRLLSRELVGYFLQRSLTAIKSRRNRQEHKTMVATCLEDIQRLTTPEEESESEDTDFLQYVESLPRPKVATFQAHKLYTITATARQNGKDVTRQRLALYLREIFPLRRPPGRPRTEHSKLTTPSRRQARRHEYAAAQRLWRKNRRLCINNILEDTGAVRQPPQEVMEPYWTNIMNQKSINAPVIRKTRTVNEVWAPITSDDLKHGRLPLGTASGPDGVSARLLRSVPSSLIVRLYNLIMWCGLPEGLLLSKTVFLPKKADAKLPGDFRPITMPSVIVRSLHRILARRIMRTVDIDPRQRAFRNTDGCADNIFLLDTILRYHRAKYKSLCLASLDISKAFDSVSHNAIATAMTSAGLPKDMIEYVMSTYHSSKTRLYGENWVSRPLHPQRGVKQGDPLSPVIFNIVFDGLLRRLPPDIGSRIGSTPINAAAFADDLVLFAETPDGLQKLIEVVVQYLGECGMSINVDKSLTLCIKASGYLKRTAVDCTNEFMIGNRRLPTIKKTDQWRYLGVYFTPEGRTKCRPTEIVTPLLHKLTRAPLKPQQRLCALRTMIVPKLYHQLALGAVTIEMLNKADRALRNTVRGWLALPHDVPGAYFHAAVRDGGLGIPCLRWTAPLLRLGRLQSARAAYDGQGLDGYLDAEISRCRMRLTDHGVPLDNTSKIRDRWARRLYDMVDGGGLRSSRDTPHQHQWIADGNMFLTGRDFVNCGRLRISALPTRSRTSRGRYKDRRCRAGCTAQETLNHVLQQCHRTHATRIKRHDAILDYLERGIRRGGYEIHREPRYRVGDDLRKPDLVAVLGRSAVVVDAQVVSEQTNLDQAHHRKITYYATPGITQAIKREHKVDSVIYTSATLSWKGVWSPQSAGSLRELGFISTKDLKVISTRVLIGGLAEFRVFNALTSVAYRTGVG